MRILKDKLEGVKGNLVPLNSCPVGSSLHEQGAAMAARAEAGIRKRVERGLVLHISKKVYGTTGLRSYRYFSA